MSDWPEIVPEHPIWDAVVRAYWRLRMWPYPPGTQGRIYARVDTWTVSWGERRLARLSLLSRCHVEVWH